jgi:hypothetical protein
LNKFDSEALLRALLAASPGVSVHAVRAAHPAFRAMSFDHLGLRIDRALRRSAATGGK